MFLITESSGMKIKKKIPINGDFLSGFKGKNTTNSHISALKRILLNLFFR